MSAMMGFRAPFDVGKGAEFLGFRVGRAVRAASCHGVDMWGAAE
jgi:hypothetical protein